jgi:hypothetical protein
MLRGYFEEQNDFVATDESFLDNRLLQNMGEDCSDMDVVDACRGTGVGNTYTGAFHPYEGDCDGAFYPGLPIYKSEKGNLFMYAIEKYGDDAIGDIKGLIRWRIVSFQNFIDKTSCRREEANIFQIDFAADGQPFNFYPTIYCFDDGGSDFSGFVVSTINIRCNDFVVGAGNTAGNNDATLPPADNGGGAGVAIAVTVIVLLVVGIGGYFYWKRHQEGYGDKAKRKKKREAKKAEKRDAAEKREAEEKRKEEEEKLNKEEEKLENEKEKPKEASLTEETSSDEEKAPKPSLSRKSSFKEAPPRSRSRSRSRRRNSVDPPARLSSRRLDANDGIPTDIQKMVADLDDFFVDPYELDLKEPTKKHKPAANIVRSKSLEPDRSTKHASRSNTRGTSLERAPAGDYADKKGRSRSVERSKASDYADKTRGRSGSVERSKANDYADKTRGRSQSIDRPKANDYADKNLGRSRSKERPKADDYADKNRGRSQSIERSKANESADKRRPRSVERSGATDFAEKAKPRSRSLEPANANNFADKKQRGRSMTKKPDPRPSLAQGNNGTIGRSKSGKFALDASKANNSVTKNPDGSVLVIAKRTREDGATVTTKTKYASVALARKHGIDV